MRTIPALEAKNRFGQLIEAAQREPVAVTKQGRPAVIVLSAAEYERYRRYLGEQLLASVHELQEEAAQKGLTEEELEKLLGDES